MIWQPTTLQGFQQKLDSPHFIVLLSLSLGLEMNNIKKKNLLSPRELLAKLGLGIFWYMRIDEGLEKVA